MIGSGTTTYTDNNDGSGSCEPICTLQHPKYKNLYSSSKATFSPSGNCVAAGSSSGSIFIWNLDYLSNSIQSKCKIIEKYTHNSTVTSCIWNSCDGSQLATTSLDKNCFLFYSSIV
jgi:WD40 repeat protein